MARDTGGGNQKVGYETTHHNLTVGGDEIRVIGFCLCGRLRPNQNNAVRQTHMLDEQLLLQHGIDGTIGRKTRKHIGRGKRDRQDQGVAVKGGREVLGGRHVGHALVPYGSSD